MPASLRTLSAIAVEIKTQPIQPVPLPPAVLLETAHDHHLGNPA